MATEIRNASFFTEPGRYRYGKNRRNESILELVICTYAIEICMWANLSYVCRITFYHRIENSNRVYSYNRLHAKGYHGSCGQ